MADDQSIGFLFKEDDSGRKFALLSTIIVVGLAFHGYMFFVVKENDIQNKYSIPSFSINFEINHGPYEATNNVSIAYSSKWVVDSKEDNRTHRYDGID